MKIADTVKIRRGTRRIIQIKIIEKFLQKRKKTIKAKWIYVFTTSIILHIRHHILRQS